MKPRRIVVLLIGGTIAAACATTPRTAASREAACPLTQEDSVFLGGGPVYRDCAVDAKVKRVSMPRVDYRPTPTGPGNGCFAVEVRMVVDTLGKPEVNTAKIVRASDRSLADAVVASLSSWRFEPAKLGKSHVRQITTEKYTIAYSTRVVAAGQSPPPPMRPARPPSC